MILNQLEQAVLERFIKSEGLKVNKIDFHEIQVVERDFTGSGFMTWLEPNKLLILNGAKSFTGGKIGARINSTIEAGFIFYIKDGSINTMEGYTYGEEWPEEVKNFKIYVIDPSLIQKK